jgi:putative ABC transport system substrate-binding protein
MTRNQLVLVAAAFEIAPDEMGKSRGDTNATKPCFSPRTITKQIEVLEAPTGRDIDMAFARLSQKPTDALLVGPSPLLNNRRVQLVTLATYHRVPAIYSWREAAEVGGLMSYGTSITDANRQAGVYTGRILKGEKPADLPVMQSIKFEFVINLNTARAFGLSFPPGLLAIADEVIE